MNGRTGSVLAWAPGQERFRAQSSGRFGICVTRLPGNDKVPVPFSPAMSIQLTPQQQEVLDSKDDSPPRVIDPRNNTTYILVPEVDYESFREFLEDERRQQAIHAIALRNAAGRVNDTP